MDAMDYGDDSDHDLISKEMLEDICDGSQTHPNINRRESCYKIRDRIKQRQSERKGALKATRDIRNGLHKVFNTVVKGISQELTPLGESGTEVSHFTSEKFLGSEMKWETSEPDSPKCVNSCEISFTTVLNALYKPLPMLPVAFNAPFHSYLICLIQ